MKLSMTQEQFFCLRNFAASAQSLHMTLTVSRQGQADIDYPLDLRGGDTDVPGLLVLIRPQTGGTGLLCIGMDPTQQIPPVTAFRLQLEHEGNALRSLHLECGCAEAAEAYAYHSIPWQEQPLACPEIRFTAAHGRIFVELGDAPVPREPVRTAQPSSEAQSMAEDIRADLSILRHYSGSEAGALRAAFEALLPQAGTASATPQLQTLEARLSELIRRTQADLQRYRDAQ